MVYWAIHASALTYIEFRGQHGSPKLTMMTQEIKTLNCHYLSSFPMLHRRWLRAAGISRQFVRANHHIPHFWTNAKLSASDKYPLSKDLAGFKHVLQSEPKPTGRKSARGAKRTTAKSSAVARDGKYSTKVNNYFRTQIVSPELCGTSSPTCVNSNSKMLY